MNPSVLGRSVTFTASVTGDDGSPTGTVVFTVDGTAQASVPLSHFGGLAGLASYTTASLSIGSHTITAAYSGDGKFPPSASTPLTEAVNAHVNPQYVSPSGLDSNPGTQAAPKLTIQAALNSVISGDVVLISSGTYTGPGNVDLILGGQNNITVVSPTGPGDTIIDCQGSIGANHRGFSLNTETGTQITGLTIENGYEGGGHYGSGGGILNFSTGLTLRSCILKNNTASGGGGLYNSIAMGGIVRQPAG